MKTPLSSRLLLRAAALLVAAVFVGGCLKERLAWSPDGKLAAILTADGLHLCDATGKISPLLAPGAYRIAWLPDSQRLVLARKKEVRTFAEVAAALGPDRTRKLTTKAESVGKMLKDLPRAKEMEKLLSDELGADIWGVFAYLREQPPYLKVLREKLGKDWNKDDETKPLDLNEVVVARATATTLEFGPTLYVGLPEIHALRPSSGGRAVAFTMSAELSPHPDTGICVLVAPADGSTPAAVVATQSTTNPDWTPDGRSLVFFKANGSASTGDDLRLGALVQREVLDADGRIQLAKESTDLAGLIFHQQNRVRCLRDGRVLFNASPFTLPTTGNKDNDREQFFLLDLASGTAVRPLIPNDQLEPLPKLLSIFEVSPDGTQVMFCSDKADGWLFTLATGAVERFATGLESTKGAVAADNYPAPVWRGAGEITFLRRATSAAGQTDGESLELVLRRGATDTVLSRNWDPNILKRLIE
jgi:hypothetical protein